MCCNNLFQVHQHREDLMTRQYGCLILANIIGSLINPSFDSTKEMLCHPHWIAAVALRRSIRLVHDSDYGGISRRAYVVAMDSTATSLPFVEPVA
ncbi:hypothetical protein A0H81_06878 [Grifola frondosa]|uniref:Uncharacterized protein n=1 Tax=Grifola frondosa TaxID=5627 RepID=A0A1C7M8S6_GRIFR|nr:hypothetical protein A0H81_06878 [Grifola frondosa]